MKLGCLGRGKTGPSPDPLYILTHHKCATTWLVFYVRDFAKLNRLTFAHTHYSGLLPGRPADIVILTNAAYAFLKGRIAAGVHIIRNPLDLVVSAYYSHKHTHSLDGWPNLARQRSLLNQLAKHDGMSVTAAFLENEAFHDGACGPLHALGGWDFDDSRFVTLKMEDVVQSPSETLGGVLMQRFRGSRLPKPTRYSFETITGRRVGEVDLGSHFRSGRANQWREELSDGVGRYIAGKYRHILDRFYPDSVELLG